MAPMIVETLRDRIGVLKAGGLAILLAERGAEFSVAPADRSQVLKKERAWFSGTAAALRTTHEGALEWCALADLKRHAVDLL